MKDALRKAVVNKQADRVLSSRCRLKDDSVVAYTKRGFFWFGAALVVLTVVFPITTYGSVLHLERARTIWLVSPLM